MKIFTTRKKAMEKIPGKTPKRNGTEEERINTWV